MKNLPLFIIGAVIATIILVILATLFLSTVESAKPYNVPLEVWGVFDDAGHYQDMFTAYKETHSFVKDLNYRKFTEEAYRDDLLNALAAGNGPDIFMIHNSWLPDFQDKIVPAPEYLMNLQDSTTHFADVVTFDMYREGEGVYGVPLSVDSLGLYYNKDIFNAAGITVPPRTWEEFNRAVERVTRIDDYGNIIQSGAALGTGQNINRSMDIVLAHMLQHGVVLSQEGGLATFDKTVTIGAGQSTSGATSMEYYTSFADATSPRYTWNREQHYSIDEFTEGGTAMMINYSWHYNTIKAKNAKLNFAVAPLPQKDVSNVGQQANYANYWVYVVAKNRPVKNETYTNEVRVHEAWQLLRAMSLPATEARFTHALDGSAVNLLQAPQDLTKLYLAATKKPAARRDIIEEQKTDVALAPFAEGNLVARSWRRASSEYVDPLLTQMITQVVTKERSIAEALKLAAERITTLSK